MNHTTVQSTFSILLYPTIPFLALSYTTTAIAILLNAIETKLILRNIKRATDFEILLLNLAIADLLNSVLFVSVTVVVQQSKNAKNSVRGSGSFRWLMATLAFSVTASASFVAAIGIERFFAIKLPLQHRLWHTKRKRLVRYILFTWLFDVILVVSFLLSDRLRLHTNPNSISYFVAGTLTFGAVLIVVVYTWVLHLMILRSLKLFDFDQKELRIDAKRIKEAMKKEKTSIIICILVVLSFLVCNLPIVADVFQLQITMTSVTLLKLSGVLNPLIYFFKTYIERCYAKKKLVPPCEEKKDSKKNQTSSEESNGKGRGSEVIDHSNQGLTKEDISIDVFEVTKVLEKESAIEDSIRK